MQVTLVFRLLIIFCITVLFLLYYNLVTYSNHTSNLKIYNDESKSSSSSCGFGLIVNVSHPHNSTLGNITSSQTNVTSSVSVVTFSVTVPSATFTTPSIASTVPSVSSSIPSVTSSAPSVTLSVPRVVTSSVPVVTSSTTVPSAISTVPSVPSSIPSVTSSIPSVTSSVPSVPNVLSSVSSVILSQPSIMPSPPEKKSSALQTPRDPPASTTPLSPAIIDSAINCFRYEHLPTLPNLLSVKPAENRSIFFLETSCKSHLNGKISITPRQACSVEAAARTNDNFEIHLVFASPGVVKDEGSDSDRIIKALMSYSNIKLSHVNYEEFLRGTPIENLYSSGKLEKSSFAIVHASDVLRIATLWRYGGMYLDLDSMMLKSLDGLALNLAAAESMGSLANAVLRVESQGAGHVLATKYLEDLRDHFDGTSWGHNGPGLVSRVLLKWCNVTTIENILKSNCPEGIKVYPPETFYPVSYGTLEVIFNPEKNDEMLRQINGRYAVHFWNALTAETVINVGSNSPYENLAKKFCPKVLAECSKTF